MVAMRLFLLLASTLVLSLSVLVLLIIVAYGANPSNPKLPTPVPATYAVIMGFPTLLLKPVDGWICRCLLLATPLCSCAPAPVVEEDPNAREIPIYY